VPRRTPAVLPDGDPAGPSDLGGDLHTKQQSAESRSCALGELHLDGPHGCTGDLVDEPGQRERPVGLPATDVPGAHLHHEIAAVAVVQRDPALAGVLVAVDERSGPVERLDRSAGERPKLMPEMFTSDDGRNAPARRTPPTTLAHGTGKLHSGPAGSAGFGSSGNAARTTIR